MKINIFVIIVLLCSYTICFPAFFPKDTFYKICFTPYENCTGDIVKMIDAAKESIYVQAYSFTSRALEQALLRAHQRGIKVSMIFDHSQFENNYHGHKRFYSSAQFFIEQGIPVWEDSLINIAHNKVMVVDQEIVETGSFNYTTSAQRFNAENVLIIKNRELAKAYLDNWYRRMKVSRKV